MWVLYWFWSHKIHPSTEEHILSRRIKWLTDFGFGGITLYVAWKVHLACLDPRISDQNMAYAVRFWQTISLKPFITFAFCMLWIGGNTLRTTRRTISQVRQKFQKPPLLKPVLFTLPAVLFKVSHDF